MEKVFTHGAMGKCTMESGIKDSNMVTEYGEDCTTIHTLENGDIPKLRGMECILGKMGTDMKENGSNA